MRKKLPLLLIPLIIGGMVVAPVVHLATANVEPIIIGDDTFDDIYAINATIDMPSTAAAYFKKADGTLTKANYGEICFPNGEARTPGKYTLNQAGQYVISYIDSEGVTFKKEFVVNKFVHELGSGASAVYVDEMTRTGLTGIKTTLVSGAALRLNKIVNIYDIADGNVDMFHIYPFFRATRDDAPKATYCTVKLIDAYDESRFIEAYVWCGSGETGTPYYCGAGASTQNFTGLENNPNRPERNNCVYEGQNYLRHVASRYQSVDAYGVWFDFGADDGAKEMIEKGGAKVNFNLNNGKVFINNSSLVTDLDSDEVYGQNTIDMKSFFTTGEVIPQIECFGYNSASMDVEIVSLAGLSGEELKNAMVEDTTAPSIKNPYSGRSITITRGKEFIIPKDVFGLDINSIDYLKTSVYYNYGQSDQITIASGDSFIPSSVGKYTVVYTAKDAYGNTSTSTLTLNCTNKAPFIYEPISITSLNGAEENIIPKLNVISNNDGLVINAYALGPSGFRQELKEIDGGYSIVPFFVGEYSIVYEIKNDFYNETYTVKVNSIDKDSIYFSNEPALYPYYMKNASYTLEDFSGYKASPEGPIAVTTVPFVSFDGGEYQVVSDPDKIEITGESYLKFKFVNGNFVKETDQIGIVDTNFGNKTIKRNYSTYFQGDYNSATDTSQKVDGKYPSEMKYSFTHVGQMDFVNLISASTFKFDFSSTMKANDTVEVKLSDYINNDNYISINVKRADQNNYVVKLVEYNDKVIQTVSLPYYSDVTNAKFEISISGGRVFVISNSKTIINTELVPSFELSKLIVKVSDAMDVVVNKVNDISFAGSNLMFEKAPIAYLTKDFSSIVLGGTYTIIPCIPSSVLSPVLNEDVLLTVTLPNGSYAKDVNGLELKNVDGLVSYDIVLSVPGQYRVNYNVSAWGSDILGAKKFSSIDSLEQIAYVVNVNDDIAPVVKFSSSEDLEIKVGDRIKIRSVTMSDNVTPTSSLVLRIFVTDSAHRVLMDGYNVTEYTFRQAGTYYVEAYVNDEAGNQGMASYKVIVRA